MAQTHSTGAVAPQPTPHASLIERIMGHLGHRFVIGVPMVFLILTLALPGLEVLRISLAESDGVRFAPLLSVTEGVLEIKLRFTNYLYILTEDPLYLEAYLSSFQYALLTTVICLAIGYPFAYFMARARPSVRPALLMLVTLPFWTSFLLRVYAWRMILADNGVLNNLLIGLGVTDEPFKLLYTPFSLVLGMVYTYLPFMVLPMYANLVKMDLRLLEAARDLGATPWQAFWRITVPLSRGGILAGSLLVFIPCVGEFVIPELLGGPSTLMIGRVLWDEFFSNNDWPMAASVAILMVLLIIVPMVWFSRHQDRQNAGAHR